MGPTEANICLYSSRDPQELPIFPAATEAYFGKPAEALKQLRSKDRALVLGMDSLAVVLTVTIVNIELNENMEFASPSSISPPGAQHASRVGRRRSGGL
jgi:hypothetical protein